MSKIIVNRLDYARIKKCISDATQFKSISSTEAEKLLKELDLAKIVEPGAIPLPKVITIHNLINYDSRED
jgi:regulator of nucleoside diphosphate kinase